MKKALITGINEVGIDASNGKTLIEISEKYFRSAEVDLLFGDCSKARNKLGWTNKVNFEQLVTMMVDADYNKIKTENR